MPKIVEMLNILYEGYRKKFTDIAHVGNLSKFRPKKYVYQISPLYLNSFGRLQQAFGKNLTILKKNRSIQKVLNDNKFDI